MNKQDKGNGSRGIQWCDYTWNPVQGCQHDCRWTMPDGSEAICYAEELATRLRSEKFFPEGFKKVYFHPERLEEPKRLKNPSRIFLDSMSDLMGQEVSDEQIWAVLQACEDAPQHTFQLLTKNAPRLLKFDFPHNVWVGASVPPSKMYGKELDRNQQIAMLQRTLDILAKVDVPVRWMSLEPVSWDCAELFTGHPLEWVVIGAASNGNKVYQPDPVWVWKLLAQFAVSRTPVFYKGNLEGNLAASPWREEFPTIVLESWQKAHFVPPAPIAPYQPSMFPAESVDSLSKNGQDYD